MDKVKQKWRDFSNTTRRNWFLLPKQKKSEDKNFFHLQMKIAKKVFFFHFCPIMLHLCGEKLNASSSLPIQFIAIQMCVSWKSHFWGGKRDDKSTWFEFLIFFVPCKNRPDCHGKKIIHFHFDHFPTPKFNLPLFHCTKRCNQSSTSYGYKGSSTKYFNIKIIWISHGPIGLVGALSEWPWKSLLKITTLLFVTEDSSQYRSSSSRSTRTFG